MSNTLRKNARGIDRQALKRLTVQVFIYRQLWEDFETELKALPEQERPKDTTTAVHALIASWTQGRLDARRKNTGGLIQVAGTLPGDAEGQLTRKLKLES